MNIMITVGVRLSERYREALENVQKERDLENPSQTLRFILRDYFRNRGIDLDLMLEVE